MGVKKRGREPDSTAAATPVRQIGVKVRPQFLQALRMYGAQHDLTVQGITAQALAEFGQRAGFWPADEPVEWNAPVASGSR